jgi:hypothetical protein
VGGQIAVSDKVGRVENLLTFWMKRVKLMQWMKTLGGGNMDRKELLLKLCEKLTSTVDYLYGEDSWSKAHLGEVLGRYASVLSDIGWAITWANEEVQEKVFRVVEEAFRLHEQRRLKCSLEEWLRWKVSEVIEEAMSEEETETQKPTPETDELPF